jgi:sugar (pentulose or hexulose) kinase
MKVKELVLVFDIGKTNKKVLLFDRQMKVVHEEESRFEEGVDEEGFPCEDAGLLEAWIFSTLQHLSRSEKYRIVGINFSAYGATLVHLDQEGKRIGPIYNYLKPLPEKVLEGFFETFGGKEEFMRKTASPFLGMLNSGLQLLWLKRIRPETFQKVKHVLHLPQYLAGLIHSQKVSEYTSIGCHTMMWDFDRMGYHSWLKTEGITLPVPIPVSETFPVVLEGNKIEAGIGIHDSSASLAPYILAAKKPFILVSTGTWSIHMNPFNQEQLTSEQLNQDCLCFLGVHGKPVKSSRFFLGRIHDLNVERLQEHFFAPESAYKGVDPGSQKIAELWDLGEEGRIFFRKGIPQGLVDLGVDCRQFRSFDEAYARLMVDLTRLVVHSIRLIIAEKDTTCHLYVSGGFARNPIFLVVLSLAFPGKQVYASEMDNASSLGAALVIANKVWAGSAGTLDLNLTSPALHHPPR